MADARSSSNVTLRDLFGGQRPWSGDGWTASDDRVRGGKSESHFETKHGIGRFYGNLDIQTLGGAGFASHRTTDEDRTWDLSEYDGIQLVVNKADGKRYTLIVKDLLLPPNQSNGREQATTSYEYDFVVDNGQSEGIRVPWSSFKPTYRGREQKDAKPLDKSQIKRFSIMMRSFFGTQQGPFSISFRSISAYKTLRPKSTSDCEDLRKVEAGPDSGENKPPKYRPWTARLTVCLATVLTIAAVHVLYKRWVR